MFRFLFTLPLLALGIDGVLGGHRINSDIFRSGEHMSQIHNEFHAPDSTPPDFLLAVGGIGCFISSAITLLVNILTDDVGTVLISEVRRFSSRGQSHEKQVTERNGPRRLRIQKHLNLNYLPNPECFLRQCHPPAPIIVTTTTKISLLPT